MGLLTRDLPGSVYGLCVERFWFFACLQRHARGPFPHNIPPLMDHACPPHPKQPQRPSHPPPSSPQVIRSRLQQRVDPSRSVRYVGVAHALRLTLRREGLAGLYRGLAPNVLRVMPQSAITFVVYESIMKWLQPPPRQGPSRPR